MKIFQAFLKSEFSDENLEFWVVCEDYKKIRSSFRMSARAKKIFKLYIQAEAPREVRTVLFCFLLFQMHNTVVSAGDFITFPLISDQHWSQDQGSDRDEHKGSFCDLFWWCPEDCLWVNGERLIPTLPEVGHLQNINGLYIRISEDVNLWRCSKQDCKAA